MGGGGGTDGMTGRPSGPIGGEPTPSIASTLMLMGGSKEEKLDLNAPVKQQETRSASGKSGYDNLFES